jgi:hypothetical protein
MQIEMTCEGFKSFSFFKEPLQIHKTKHQWADIELKENPNAWF